MTQFTPWTWKPLHPRFGQALGHNVTLAIVSLLDMLVDKVMRLIFLTADGAHQLNIEIAWCVGEHAGFFSAMSENTCDKHSRSV